MPPSLGDKPRKYCCVACCRRGGRPRVQRPTKCEDCGGDLGRLGAKGRPRRVCKDCANARSRATWRAKKSSSSCTRCGITFEHSYGANTRFCSAECRRPAAKQNRPADCKGCGASYIRRSSGQQYCSRECRAKSSASKLPRPCLRCGITFRPGPYRNAGKFCSRGCAFAAIKEGHPLAREKGVQRGGGRSIKARCEHYGAPYTPISKRAIFDRSGWVCQLCGCDLLRRQGREENGRIDGRSPTVDHIVPVSLGPGSPGHVWGNVQAACRRCNVLKGAQPLDSFAASNATGLH